MYSFEIIFTIISLLIFIFIGFSSEIIAKNFINTEIFSQKELAKYISIMGGCIGLQLFTSMLNSGLLGLEKQVEANILQSSGSLLRSGIVLFPLYFYPTLTTFFVWQLGVNILIFLITRYRLWSHIKIEIKPKLDFKILRSIRGFTLGLFGLAVLSAMNTQLDKVIISNLVTLKEFAIYSLGNLVAQAPMMIIVPISVAFLPKIVKLSDENKKMGLIKLYRFESFIIAGLASLVAVLLIVFLEEILILWLSDELIINEILKFAKILILANLFLALQINPFHLGIAHGHTKTSVKVSFSLLFLIIPVIIWAIKNFGLIGVAYTILSFNLTAWIVLSYILNGLFISKKYLKGLVVNIFLPILINVMIGIIISYLKSLQEYPLYVNIFLFFFQAIISFVILGFLAKKIISKKDFKVLNILV